MRPSLPGEVALCLSEKVVITGRLASALGDGVAFDSALVGSGALSKRDLLWIDSAPVLPRAVYLDWVTHPLPEPFKPPPAEGPEAEDF